MAKMVAHKGIRYREEDAKRRGIEPDGDAMPFTTKRQPKPKPKDDDNENKDAKPKSKAASHKARQPKDEADGGPS